MDFEELTVVAQREPVTVEKRGRGMAVVLAAEKYDELVAAQDALWEAAAIAIINTGKPLSSEEGLKILSGYVPTNELA